MSICVPIPIKLTVFESIKIELRLKKHSLLR